MDDVQAFDPAETYALLAGGGVKRGSDNASIPPDANNYDWRQYQAWIASGKTPTPVVVAATVAVATAYQIALALNASGGATAFATAVANAKPPDRLRWGALDRAIPANNPVFTRICTVANLDPVATIAAAATRT